jgi:hypothetical protein
VLAMVPFVAGATPAPRITICHATGSVKNPYTEITISENGLNGQTGPNDIIPAPATGCPTSSVVPTITFIPSATSLFAGSILTLTWAATNVTSCTASNSASDPNWSGSVAISGSTSIPEFTVGTITYTLTCTGTEGTVSASAPVTISIPGGV